MKKQRKYGSLSRFLAFVLSVTMLAGLCPQGVSFFGMSLTLPKVQAAQHTLSNPRIVKDSSMEAGQKVTWDCVYFGSYPQTEVVESGSKEETSLKGINTYYGSKYQAVSRNAFAAIKNASYDANGDATVGGTKYRRLRLEDVTYVGSFAWKGRYHYFKYEPIKWRVLSRKGNDALLLADVVLDTQKYNTELEDVTWETSSIRSWLNGYEAFANQPKKDYSRKNFLNSAFTSVQRNIIKTTSVVNNNNIAVGTAGGNNTLDKVFLLSESEVYNTDVAVGYGFVKNDNTEDEARKSRSSRYAYAMGGWYDDEARWWLRSPGCFSCYAAEVTSFGDAYSYGDDVNLSRDGVRPALHLNLSSSNLYSYAGTVCSDEMKSGERQKQTNYSWDEASGTLTVTGSCDMEDYSASSPAPWAGYRNKIKKVIVESGVTGIGSYAFENCKNLSSVEIGNTVQKIGEGAFSNCLKLKSVTIPSSVDTIAYGAFWWCPDLDTVYFEGNAPEMGDEIFHNMSLTAYYVANDKTWTSAKRGNYGGHVTWKTWYGNREEGSIYVDPMNLGEISVNNKGKGYSWYTLTDAKGSPITDTEIEYTIGSTCKTTKTNARGEFAVASPTVTKDTEFTVKITTKDARPLKNASQSFTVKVTTLSYSSEYTLSNSITGGGTLTTPIAGGGGESEVGGRSIIKYQTDDKGTHLTFQQAMDGTYKGSVDNSTKAVTDKLLTGVSSSCIPAVKGSSNASYKNSITGGMYFDNYVPKDPDQSLQITAALLMMGNGTNTTSIWKKALGNTLYNMTGSKINNVGVSTSTSLGSSGKLTWGNGNHLSSLVSAGSKTNYASSMELNEEKKTLSSSQSLKAEDSLNVLSLKPIAANALSSKKSNAVGLSITQDTSGGYSVSSNMTDGKENEILLGKTSSSDVRKLTLSKESSNNLLENQSNAKLFADGTISTLGTADFVNGVKGVWSSDTQGTIKNSKKIGAGVQISGIAMGYPKEKPILSVNCSFSGSQEVSYDYASYAWNQGRQYVLSESDISDKSNEMAENKVKDIVNNALIGSAASVGKCFDSLMGSLKDTVNKGKAYVSGKSAEIQAGITAITNDIKKSRARSFAIMAVNEGEEEQSAAATMGSSYMVQLYDKEEKILEDTEVKKQGATLTLAYDNTMLNAAGVDENTPVYIYQYDEERGIYVCRTDSAQDKGKKEVSVPLEKNGEYILGVDVSAPEVSDMNVSNTTASPVFSAKVIDGNGVKDFEMKLDDKEIVNAASFAQYYNEKTGKFTCPLKGLTAGKHTVTIHTEDTLGNKTETPYTYEFTVDDKAPEITKANLSSDELFTEDSVYVEAKVTDDTALDKVNCVLEDEEGNIDYEEMTELDDGLFNIGLSDFKDRGKYKVSIMAVDKAGNSNVYTLKNALKVYNAQKSGLDITSLTINKNTGNMEVSVVNHDFETRKGTLLIVGYDKSGKMAGTVSKELSIAENGIKNDSEKCMENVTDIQAFILCDGNTIADCCTYTPNGVITEDISASEESVIQGENGQYTFEIVNSDALEIKEGQYYTLTAVKGTKNAQYVPNLADTDTICGAKAQQAMKTQSGTAAINFGTINIAKEKEVSFYLIGAGKVQYIQSFSGTGEETCKHKNVVTDPRKEPTCTETGLTEGSHCGDCNAVLVEQKVLPVAGHKEVIDPAVAPTETTPGKTEGKHCSVCNAILVAQKEIPPTGKKPTDNTGSDTNTSTEDTTKPDGKGDTKPAENPKPSQKPTTNPKPSTKPAGNALLKIGTQVTDKKTGAVYKVNGIRTVEYKKSLKKTTSIAIPSVLNIKGVKYQVTSIAPKAFMNNKKLKKVVIPATIRSIGKKAFVGCKNLKKITVKTPYLTKTSVGAKAFKGIHAKAAIKVPKKKKKAYTSLFKAKGVGKKVKIK